MRLGSLVLATDMLCSLSTAVRPYMFVVRRYEWCDATSGATLRVVRRTMAFQANSPGRGLDVGAHSRIEKG